MLNTFLGEGTCQDPSLFYALVCGMFQIMPYLPSLAQLGKGQVRGIGIASGFLARHLYFRVGWLDGWLGLVG